MILIGLLNDIWPFVKVDPNIAKNPAWRSRLIISITDPSLPTYNDTNNIFEKYLINILGSLKNGKLYGLVQIYGQMTADPRYVKWFWM